VIGEFPARVTMGIFANRGLLKRSLGATPGRRLRGFQSRNSHSRFQMLAVAPAQRKPGSAVEKHVVPSICIELDASYPIEVHDGRAMNAAENVLVQLSVDFRHSSAQHMRLCSHVQEYVVIGGFDLAAYTGTEDQAFWDTSKPSGFIFRTYNVSRLRTAGFLCQYTLEQALHETYDWHGNHCSVARH
jgi:hypothetical protein